MSKRAQPAGGAQPPKLHIGTVVRIHRIDTDVPTEIYPIFGVLGAKGDGAVFGNAVGDSLARIRTQPTLELTGSPPVATLVRNRVAVVSMVVTKGRHTETVHMVYAQTPDAAERLKLAQAAMIRFGLIAEVTTQGWWLVHEDIDVIVVRRPDFAAAIANALE